MTASPPRIIVQPAALRYQINHMGFTLGIAQGSYTPNFTGYMGEAQRIGQIGDWEWDFASQAISWSPTPSGVRNTSVFAASTRTVSRSR